MLVAFVNVPLGAEARAFFVFGDSLADNGNNDFLVTTARADSPPYGIDFPTHRPTGRFSNGLNIPDLISEHMGMKSPLPYMNPLLKGNKLLHGANFASAGIGILNDTGIQFDDFLMSMVDHNSPNERCIVVDSNTSKAIEAGGESDKWIIVLEEVVAFDWLGSKALVGRVMDLRTLNNLHFILKDCGFSEVDKDLSVLCIGVLRGEGNRIRDSYTLVARNNKFKTWISEEECAWTSDCSQPLSMTVTETVGSRDPVKEDEESEEGEFREVRMEVEDQEGDHHGEGGVQGDSVSVEPISDTWYEGCSRDDNLHGDTNSTALKKSVKRNKFILGRTHKKKIQIKELERPRKRSKKEMEEDPFDLDYLLGLGQNLKGGGGMSSTSVEVHEASGEKGIDLNVRADSESQIDGEADRTGQNEGSESEGSGSNLGEPQTKKWRRKYRLRLKWE
ncbi:hypothetical protein L1987_65150 [Smallanthus sonchifolius]|uniref:Uncharacterized protein n=1 Tax=Smallanthus sonchifolius TaxID=185202 RepID=A0ACB9BTV5_9ASTR|nr:hypothetical protein L1987_65150 [Smallanthus sonchifolius]